MLRIMESDKSIIILFYIRSKSQINVENLYIYEAIP